MGHLAGKGLGFRVYGVRRKDLGYKGLGERVKERGFMI